MTEANRAADERATADEAATDEMGRDRVDEASAESMDASDPPAFGGVTGIGAGPADGEERHERIARRAHDLWVEAGSPEGRAMEFWLQAERELGEAAVETAGA